MKKIITSIVAGLKAASYLKYAMADYLVYLTINILSDGYKNLKPFIDGTKTLINNYNANNSTYESPLGNQLIKGNGAFMSVISWDDYLEDTDTTNKGTTQATKIINKESLQFYNPINYTDSYLYKWWKQASTDATLKNFPKTFKELITVTLPNFEKVDLTQNLEDFQLEVINTTTTRNPGSIKAKNLFIYRYFNNNPITELQSPKFCETFNDPANEAY